MKKFRLNIIFSIILGTLLLTQVQFAFAQGEPVQAPQAGFVKCGRHLPANATEADIKANACTIPKLIQMIANIINFLLSWAWLIATLFIVWAGWQMINAGGNEEALSTAKTTLTNAIIGFFLILASYVLLNFVVSVVTGEESFSIQKILEAFNLVK